tara:strand:+ start:5444 stop:6448 length:1005 start_codon:yes stop_codon:yes gene_type:complete
MDKQVQDYIEKISIILQNPSGGENPITPTQDQIAQLQKAENIGQAMLLGEQYGWGNANDIYILENPLDNQEIDISTIIQQAIAGEQGPDFIGVRGDTPITYQGLPTTIGEYENNFYIEGDQNFGFTALMPDKIMELQADLVNAGLLGPAVGKPFRPGVWQRGLEGKIMYQIMSEANTAGIGKAESGWENILQVYIDNPIAMPSQVQPYLPPDYQAISNSINNLFEQDLDRAPKPYELKLLADTYLSDSKKAYDQKVKLIEESQNQVATPENLAEYGNHTQELIQDERLTDIDPSASMLSAFDRITKEEKERLGDYDDIQRTNSIILNSITGAPR